MIMICICTVITCLGLMCSVMFPSFLFTWVIMSVSSDSITTHPFDATHIVTVIELLKLRVQTLVNLVARLSLGSYFGGREYVHA